MSTKKKKPYKLTKGEEALFSLADNVLILSDPDDPEDEEMVKAIRAFLGTEKEQDK